MPLDKDDEKKIDEKISKLREEFGTTVDEKLSGLNDTINKSVTAQLKRSTKDLGESISAAVLEKIKAERPDPEDDDEVDDEKGKKGKGAKGGDPEVKKTLDAMQKKLDASEKARLDAEKRQQETEAKRARAEERDAASAILGKAGFDETRKRAALAILHTEDGKIGRSEDGKIVWKDGDTELELSKGFEGWFKSDEGKALAPARNAGGSGGTGGGKDKPGGNDKPNGTVTADQAGLALLGAMGAIPRQE